MLNQRSRKISSATIVFSFGFTPCKAEQPLQGMELEDKEGQKD